MRQNPALGVLLPEAQTKEGRYLSQDEANRLLAELPEPTHTMVLLALVTGLRRGELFGLRWGRVDLERRVVHVRETVYEGHFGTPKTKSSIRDLPIALRRLPRSVNFHGATPVTWCFRAVLEQLSIRRTW